MKNLKALLIKAKELSQGEDSGLPDTLRDLIFYSPKFPARLKQQQLLNDAETFNVIIHDPHFAKGDLEVNCFRWGNGKRKVLLTHGWGSKAADFSELITDLRAHPDLEIIAFDAPGNGSSEGKLTNLLLFARAVEAIVAQHGTPEILIGHSLGCMANAIAMQNFPEKVKVLISLAPLIQLKEHFVGTLNSVNIPQYAQDAFFEEFSKIFNVNAEDFTLTALYQRQPELVHLLAYDVNDKVSPVEYMREFLSLHPGIKTVKFDDIGHEKMLKDERVVEAIIASLEH